MKSVSTDRIKKVPKAETDLIDYLHCTKFVTKFLFCLENTLPSIHDASFQLISFLFSLALFCLKQYSNQLVNQGRKTELKQQSNAKFVKKQLLKPVQTLTYSI